MSRVHILRHCSPRSEAREFLAPWKLLMKSTVWSWLHLVALGLHTALTLNRSDSRAVPSSVHVLWFVEYHSGHTDEPDSKSWAYWDTFDLWLECLHEGLPFCQFQQSLNCSGSPLAKVLGSCRQVRIQRKQPSEADRLWLQQNVSWMQYQRYTKLVLLQNNIAMSEHFCKVVDMFILWKVARHCVKQHGKPWYKTTMRCCRTPLICWCGTCRGDEVGSQHQDARELWHFGLRGSRGTSVHSADPHIGHEGLMAESRAGQKALRTSQN